MRLRDLMWEKIPELTRERDMSFASPDAPLDEDGVPKGPLRQLVDVLGSGLEAVYDEASRFQDLIDIENCPEEHLPYLAALFGFEFPYDLNAEQQRRYLRNVIGLYRTKGTAWTLRIAALRIIGEGFTLNVTNEDRENHVFDVEITAAGEGNTVAQLEQKMQYMIEQYSPAGMIPNLVVRYYFTDITDLEARVSDEEHTSFEHTSYRLNMAGHRLNDNAKATDFGVFELAV